MAALGIGDGTADESVKVLRNCKFSNTWISYIIVIEPSGIVEMGCADLMPGSCQLSWMNEFEDGRSVAR